MTIICWFDWFVTLHPKYIAKDKFNVSLHLDEPLGNSLANLSLCGLR